jgi:hypothetical protein
MRLLNECGQSHQGALDHTRVGPCTVCVVRSYSECVCVCDVGLCVRTKVSEFECKPVSTIERIVVCSIAECKKKIYYFFYKNKINNTQMNYNCEK